MTLISVTDEPHARLLTRMLVYTHARTHALIDREKGREGKNRVSGSSDGTKSRLAPSLPFSVIRELFVNPNLALQQCPSPGSVTVNGFHILPRCLFDRLNAHGAFRAENTTDGIDGLK